MAVQNEGIRSFPAGEALVKNRRVKLNGSGEVVYADAGGSDNHIGFTLDNYASGDIAAVQLKTPTVLATAATSVTVGTAVYGAADGKVGTSSSGAVLGVAVTAASGDGAIFELMPYFQEGN